MQESYKGNFLKESEVVIETDLGNGDCGYMFDVGNRYLIYCYYQKRYLNGKKIKDTILYTNICTRTNLVTKETGKEIKILRKLR